MHIFSSTDGRWKSGDNLSRWKGLCYSFDFEEVRRLFQLTQVVRLAKV